MHKTDYDIYDREWNWSLKQLLQLYMRDWGNSHKKLVSIFYTELSENTWRYNPQSGMKQFTKTITAITHDKLACFPQRACFELYSASSQALNICPTNPFPFPHLSLLPSVVTNFNWLHFKLYSVSVSPLPWRYLCFKLFHASYSASVLKPLINTNN